MRDAARVSVAVARVTLQEVLRQKLLYNIFVFAIALFGVAYLAGRVSFINPARMVLDFGITAMGLAGTAIAVLIGASLINREFERRTVFVALSHPISRIQFLVGKYLGLSAVLFLNWSLFSVTVLGILLVTGGRFYVGATLFTALFFLFLQFNVLAAIAVFFSTFTTTTLGVVFSMGIFLVGTNVSQIRMLETRTEEPIAHAFLHAIALVWPNMEYFNLGLNVTYDLPVAGKTVLAAAAYALTIIVIALVAGGMTLEKRES